MTQSADQTLIEQVKAQLLKEKERLEGELADIAGKHRGGDYQADFPQLGNKEDENAAEVALFSDNLSLEQTLESALRDVKRALKRIEEQTYGICIYCGKPIDQRRLLARPTSRTCIHCKERVSSR
jgi:DnaK suppressor protein